MEAGHQPLYAEAAAKGKLSGEAARFANVVAEDEAAHVAFLKGALGSKAVKKPAFNFKGTTAAQATFLKTAMALEDAGVSAYAGAAPLISNKKTLSAALSGMTVRMRASSGGARCRVLPSGRSSRRTFSTSRPVGGTGCAHFVRREAGEMDWSAFMAGLPLVA